MPGGNCAYPDPAKTSGRSSPHDGSDAGGAGQAVIALALVLIGSVGGGGPARTYAADPAPTPTPVTTGNLPVLAISPLLCFLLSASGGMATGAARLRDV